MRRGTRAPWIFLLFVVLLGFGAVYVDLANTPLWPSNKGINLFGYKNSLQVQEGLDLQGGIQFLLQASCPTSHPNCNNQYIQNNLDAVVNNLNQRISQGLGVTEAVIRTEGGNRISVELPGLQDDQQAKALLGQTGQMNIVDTQGTQLSIGQQVTPCTTTCASGQYKVVFTGSQLDPTSIQAQLSPNNNAPIVTFTFAGGAKALFATYTRNNVGKYLTITLDNKVIESATINSEIDGNGEITGFPDVATAQNLASLLRYGALPLPLTYVSENHLAATLGQQAIQYSLRAALVGLGLVILFMLLYYRLPGLLADVALLLYAALLFAVIKLIGVTLSTAGIAGLILSVGMAVDANVLIFERIKEELREGRTMAAAIDIGFKRAWPSIRDSNMSTMITCAILYWFGNNFGATIIVGFATNLFLGVALSLFTAVVVTRNFLSVLLLTGVASHPALYGLPREAIRIPRYTPPRPRLGAMVPAVAGAGAGGASRSGGDGGGLSGRANGNRPADGESSAAGARRGEED
jgi:preprotein translocase subunit SecD